MNKMRKKVRNVETHLFKNIHSCFFLIFLHLFFSELNCRVPSDIVFVLDGSESLKDEDFKSMKKFVNNLLLSYPVEENFTRIGVIVFGTYPADTIKLGSTYNKYLLAARIENLAHPKSGTGTARALEAMRQMFQTESSKYSVIFFVASFNYLIIFWLDS